MSKFEKDSLESLVEAAAHSKGKKTGVRETVLTLPDVKRRKVVHP